MPFLSGEQNNNVFSAHLREFRVNDIQYVKCWVQQAKTALPVTADIPSLPARSTHCWPYTISR